MGGGWENDWCVGGVRGYAQDIFQGYISMYISTVCLAGYLAAGQSVVAQMGAVAVRTAQV
jgi:Na+/H+-translocating membrane pyrophosphatase